MNDMFKDTAFWKPILKMVFAFGAWFGLLFLLPAKAALVVTSLAVGGYFLFLLYWLGKSHYEYQKIKMERNYTKITGKKDDQDA